MPAVIAPFVQQHVDHSLCVCVWVFADHFRMEWENICKERARNALFFLERIFRLHIKTTLS